MHNRLLVNVLRMKPAPKREYKKPAPMLDHWDHELPKPVMAMDTTLIYRADSYLRGFVKDSTGLTVDEAQDVCNWSANNPRKL